MHTAPTPARFRPATRIDQVIERLDEVVERARRERDRLGLFACLYRGVTRRVRDGIAAGRFEDGARMERLDVIFANRYLEALEAYRRGERPTRSWEAAFRAARWRRLLVLQHLMLGMNAHINLDLGIAAAQTVPRSGIAGLERDFMEISRLLGEMMDGVQDQIAGVSPWMRVVDWAGCRNDEAIFGFCLGAARDLAWKTARRLAAVEPARLPREIDHLDRAVALLAVPIHTPGLLVGGALLVARAREPGDVARLIEALA